MPSGVSTRICDCELHLHSKKLIDWPWFRRPAIQALTTASKKAMPTLVFSLVLFIGTVVGLVAGLVICANTDLGDFEFADVRRDFLKCTMVALVTAAAGVGLYQLAQNARVFLALVPIFYLGVKLSWLGISTPEVVVAGGTTVLSIAMVGTIVRLLLAL
jgi:hypothetical protein